MEEKCLVTEAMDKCQCKMCIELRKLRELSARIYLSLEMQKILLESFKKENANTQKKKLQ